MAKQSVTKVKAGRATRIAEIEKKAEGIDFVKIAPLMSGVSVVLVILSIALFFVKGLNYGIDFSGGTEIQVRFDHPVDVSQVRSSMETAGIKQSSVQSFGANNEFLIRLETPEGKTEHETNELNNANVAKVRNALVNELQLKEDGVLRVDSVGPQVGSELKRNGVLAVFYSFLVILIYVGLRFDYKYAPGAVICLVHDTIVTIGIFTLLQREFNVQIMAAILTLIGYSLNDTIVTFDRIRETAPQFRDLSFKYIINKAINDTLGRTIITGGTTLLAVIALYFFAGGVIADIAFTLMIGVIIGTYSSIYVASPLVLYMDQMRKKAA